MSRFNQPQQQGQYGSNNYQNQNQGQGWRNNQSSQNYGWKNNLNNMPQPQVSEPSPKKKVDLEQALAQILTSHISFVNKTKANMQNQVISAQNVLF